MLTPNPVATPLGLVYSLATQLHELRLPSDLRTKISAACLALAQEHYHAIAVLLGQERPLTASAFALVRAEFEAYVRGMWFSHCASNEQILSFANGGKPPDMASLVSAVQKASQAEGDYLKGIYGMSWSALSAYAHTGAQQVQRWCAGEAIEPNYTEEEIQEVLRFTGAIALLSAVSVAALAGNEVLAEKFVELSSAYLQK